MKKLIVLGAFLIGGIITCNAQKDISKNAIGLRLGSNDGFGVEASYQRLLGNNKNRLEFDLGWRNNSDWNAVKLVGTYQWTFPIENGFHWYVGPGLGIGNTSYDYRTPYGRYDDSFTYLVLAGQIGIEYNFDFPLQLSLDFRPEIYLNDDIREDFGPDFAFGIRYKF